MEVVCINDNWKPSSTALNKKAPVFMEDCTVTSSEEPYANFGDNRVFYTLKGYEFDSLFFSGYFAPKSTKPEDEEVQYQKDFKPKELVPVKPKENDLSRTDKLSN